MHVQATEEDHPDRSKARGAVESKAEHSADAENDAEAAWNPSSTHQAHITYPYTESRRLGEG